MSAAGAVALTVGYSCLADRVDHIVPPASDPDVEVLVCVQGDDAFTAPPGSTVVTVAGRGVARSRNAAIDHAGGRYLLFCDDDVLVDLSGVRSAMRILEDSDAAIALGRAVDPAGDLRKDYPAGTVDLTRFNSAKAATYEMLVDVAQVRSSGIRFDERFGAGMPLHLGDEYIFITDLLAAGLRGFSVPIVFGQHPADSSGARWDDDRDVHVRAVALNRVFGWQAPGARLAFAVKHRRRLGARRAVRFLADRTRPPR